MNKLNLKSLSSMQQRRYSALLYLTKIKPDRYKIDYKEGALRFHESFGAGMFSFFAQVATLDKEWIKG